MIIATIENTFTNETRHIEKSPGATAPACLQFSNAMCGYWESRLELFEWACKAAGWYLAETLFTDGYTGEVLTYCGLLDELNDNDF